MGRFNASTTLARLIVTGILVVLGSVLASAGATHVAFMSHSTVTYSNSMTLAIVIPLLVAPASYGYVAWLSWKLERLNANLDRLAHHDALTGIFNRRAFMAKAETVLAESTAAMLVMIDIDHFKKINDRLGHSWGDLALQHTAKTLNAAAPDEAVLARLGGEEFGLLVKLECIADEQSHALVEKMRQSLESMPLISTAGRVKITASFGVAYVAPGEPLEQALNRADDALYLAKQQGRNQMALAS